MTFRRAGKTMRDTERWERSRLVSAVSRLYSLPPEVIGAADVINAIAMGKAGKI